MSKKFAVFDIDGTLIRWQLYHAVVDALVKLGAVDPKAFSLVHDARKDWKHRKGSDSFKAYEGQLVYTLHDLLPTIKIVDFEKAARVVFDEYKDQVYTYTRELLEKLKSEGYLLFAISGSPIEVVQKVADYYGFDECTGCVFVRSNGKFTGEKISPFGRKHLVIAELVKKYKSAYKGSIAVGDSDGDISMLEMVEKAIVVNPSKELFEVAKNKQWPIVIERKNVVYKLEPKNGSYELA